MMRLVTSCMLTLGAVLALAAGSAAADRDLRLLQAAKQQDWQAVASLVKEGVDVNARQGDGATALHWAAYWSHEATADVLLHAGAKVDATNDLGATPLFLACTNANGKMVEKLLAAGANPKLPVSPRTTGELPSMTAARTGSVEAVKALIAHGADVNAQETTHGQTALMWGVAHKHPRVTQTLIEAGADVRARSRIDRMVLMFAGQAEGTTGGAGMDVDAGGFTPMLFAARHGDVESAKLLLAAGADANDATPDKTSVLTLATLSSQNAVAMLLLDHGADPSAGGSGYTPLHAAILTGDLPLVKELIARHVDVNAPLKSGSAVNRETKDFAFNVRWIGASPLWLAASFAEAQMVRALAAGANVSFAMRNGSTPLMAAAGMGRRPRDLEDRRGRRLDPGEIVIAMETGSTERETFEVVKAVTEVGSDVNAANGVGNAAIHAAVTRGEKSVVQWLADHGAKVDVKNKKGDTPLSIANTPARQDVGDEGGDTKIDTKMVELLRQLGAKE